MGGGQGGSYSSSGGPLSENIQRLAKKYPLGVSGKFGVKSGSNVTVVHSANPSQTGEEFFKELSQGALRIENLGNGPGYKVHFKDGSLVVYRPTSKSGGPALNLSFSSNPNSNYKIHFESNASKNRK